MLKIFNNYVFIPYSNRKNDTLASNTLGKFLPTQLCFITNQRQDRLYSTNPYLKRAVGNFIKGVIHSRFPHTSFQDHASLIHFLHNFDHSLNYTAQALSNVKTRKLKFKPLEMTPEVQLFINYIQKRFPHFKDEWLFYPPNNFYPREKISISDYLKAFRLYIYYKYISMELVFIFLIIPNFYLIYFIANLVLFSLFLMMKDFPSLLKTIEFVSNNNNYIDDYYHCDKGLSVLSNLRKWDLKVANPIALNPVMQINFDLRNLSKSELDDFISIISSTCTKEEEFITDAETDNFFSWLRTKFLEFINRNIPKKPMMSITPQCNILPVPNGTEYDEYSITILNYGLKYNLIATDIQGVNILKTAYILDIDPNIIINKFNKDGGVLYSDSVLSNKSLSNKSLSVNSTPDINIGINRAESISEAENISRSESVVSNVSNSRKQLFDLINTQNNILANKQSYIYNLISPTIIDANTAINYNNDFIEKTLRELKYYTELVYSLEVKLEQSNDTIDNLNNVLDKIESEKQALIRFINEKEDDESNTRIFNHYKGIIDTKEQLITDLSKGLDTCLLKQDELKTEVSNANSTIVAMELELKEYHDDSIILRNKVVSLENLLSQERTKFAELTDMNSLLKDHIAANSVDIEKAKLVYRENDNHLDTINTLENYTRDLEKELRDVNNDIQMIKSNNESLVSTIDKLANEINSLNVLILELNAKFDKTLH